MYNPRHELYYTILCKKDKKLVLSVLYLFKSLRSYEIKDRFKDCIQFCNLFFRFEREHFNKGCREARLGEMTCGKIENLVKLVGFLELARQVANLNMN